MSRITCAISGIKFNCDYFEHLAIPHTEGYFHPIFAAPYKVLHHLYSEHTKGKLTSNDSYLLFLAFLHSSDCIHWKRPASCNPNDIRTKRLVESNISQLITVLEKSACIKYPAFHQPHFSITAGSCDLESIPEWIAAWESNIEVFIYGRANQTELEAIQKVENRLERLILSGDSPAKYSGVIADWASKVAEFPPHKTVEWKRIICSCFSTKKMFNTPLAAIKELKDFCECNIEVGSIHFHTLSTVLKEGMCRHVNYLGSSNYTLLAIGDTGKEADSAKNTAELTIIAESAPDKEPIADDYPNSLEFLRARLAYRVANNSAKIEAAIAAAAKNGISTNKGKEL